jgi:hypothetical protein
MMLSIRSIETDGSKGLLHDSLLFGVNTVAYSPRPLKEAGRQGGTAGLPGSAFVSPARTALPDLFLPRRLDSREEGTMFPNWHSD